MKKAVIDQNRCDRSPFCPASRSCPAGAIKQEGRGFFRSGPLSVDHDLCTGCQKCLRYCPHGAIKMIVK